MTEETPAPGAGRRMTIKVAAVFLLTCVIAGAAWWLRTGLPGGGSLIPLPFAGTNLLTHVWVRDGTLLLLLYRARPVGIEAVEWDVDSGRTNVVAGIGAALQGAGITNNLSGLDLSRDGQWLMFLGGLQTNFQLVTVRTDGSQGHCVRLMPDSTGCCWLPNSHQWLSVGPRGNSGVAIVHSADATQTWEFPITLGANINPVGTTERGEILCAWDNPTNTELMLTARMNPSNFTFSSEPRPSGLPPRLIGVFQNLQLTRKGDLLAGIAYRANRLMGPAMSYLGLAPPVSTTIWTSRPDGTDWRDVGFIRSEEQVEEVRFTPDGRNLTFLRRGQSNSVTLWRIPLK